MRTHTQLKVCFAAVLIALATLTIVTAPAQVMGAGQSKSPVVVALPQGTRESASPQGNTAGRVAANRAQKELHDLRPNPGDLSFLPPVTYYSGGKYGFFVTVSDVNGDGRPDLVTANEYPSGGSGNGAVGVLLGNGDGTFQPAVSYDSGGTYAYYVAVADLNGDGKPDLVVANLLSPNLGVLLGNGDGTFQAAVSYGSGGGGANSVVVADVNGDGKPDLVVAGGVNLGVLLGNGDGTFQAAVRYSPGSGSAANSVKVADVNGDGKLDIMVALGCTNNCKHGGVGVLLGNGDGTFQTPATFDSGGTYASSVTVADFNRDGKLDLLLANQCLNSTSCPNGSVSVLLGNGNGTFQAAVSYPLSGSAVSMAVGDLNGDGLLDVGVVTVNTGNNFGVMLGNGDGSFQPPISYDSGGNAPYSIALADVNGDAKLDVLVMDASGTGNDQALVGVLLNNSNLSPTATTLVSSPNPSLFGQAVTFTATVSSAAGTPPNGEIVTFNNGSAVLGTAPLSGGSASLITSSLATGIFTITASYSGDVDFAASTSSGLRQVVNSSNKNATSTALVSSLNPSTYGQKVTWTATVISSGSTTPTGKVQFTWSGHTIGSATLNSGGVATLTKSNLNADTYPLTAVYGGDAANLGSTSAVLNQVVLQATSSATLTSSPNPSTQGQAVTFTAKISSATVTPTGPVTFTAGKTVLGTGQLSGGKATLTISSLAVGSTTVTATYNGDSNIAKSSASVTQTVH